MDLKILVKKAYRFFIKRPYRKMNLTFNKMWNKMGNRKKCYVCHNSFRHFTKFKKGARGINNFLRQLQMVGSDIDNYGCIYCGSTDRERHLYMFFDKLSFWDKFRNARILHFAPETPLSLKIEQLLPAEYIKCDLFPIEDWRKIDITKIDFEDNYFDLLICNHVIEHVPDHLLAMKEISRVVKKNGVAILQTPYSELLYSHFEDRNINTDELRLLFYGQEDHVRIVSKRQFFDELSQYFTMDIVKNQSLFSDEECFKYGVNKKEDLVMVINNKIKE